MDGYEKGWTEVKPGEKVEDQSDWYDWNEWGTDPNTEKFKEQWEAMTSEAKEMDWESAKPFEKSDETDETVTDEEKRRVLDGFVESYKRYNAKRKNR